MPTRSAKKAPPAEPAAIDSRAVPVGPRLLRLLGADYRARRAVLLEGPTGIGKSEIVRELAQELGIGFEVLMLSLLENVDLQGMPYIDEQKRTACAVPREMPTEGQGILLLEELNRAERHVQQAAMELCLTGRTRQYTLPPGWVVFAAINPEEDDYFVTPLDPAHRARFHNVTVRADLGCWIAWAEQNGIHPAILQLARKHRGLLDAVPPRTWALVSRVLGVLRPDELHDAVLVHDLLTDLPPVWADALAEALNDPHEVIEGLEVRRVLTAYHRAPELRNRLRNLRDAGRTDAAEKLAGEVLDRVHGGGLNLLLDRGEFQLDAFEALLADLPGDHRDILQESLGDNLAAAPLVGVTPEEVLRADYAQASAGRTVAAWARDPLRGHRVRILVKALVHHLEKHPDIFKLRNSTGAMVGLGAFAAQVDATPSKAVLDEALVKLNVRPVLPARRSG
jgi:MoxR-like ATPase